MNGRRRHGETKTVAKERQRYRGVIRKERRRQRKEETGTDRETNNLAYKNKKRKDDEPEE